MELLGEGGGLRTAAGPARLPWAALSNRLTAERPGLKFGPAAVHIGSEVAPVVKSGTANLLVVHREPERADEVEPGAGHGAGSSDVPGVGRDLGRDEHDVEGRLGEGGGRHG